MIRVAEVTLKQFCKMMCFMDPDCVSVNLEKQPDVNGNYKCELNNATHEGRVHELRSNTNFSYHAVEVNVSLLLTYVKNLVRCYSVAMIFVGLFRFFQMSRNHVFILGRKKSLNLLSFLIPFLDICCGTNY